MNEPERVFQPPTSMDRIRQRLEKASKYSFWFQVVLGVLAGLTWLFVMFGRLSGRLGYTDAAGTKLAFWTVLLALLALAANIFFTWQCGKTRGGQATGYPQEIQWVLFITLGGMLLTIISSAAQVGELLASTFFGRFSVSFEIPGLLLAAASTYVNLAYFGSLVFILWIYGFLDRR
jgi:hypothetical protein